MDTHLSQPIAKIHTPRLHSERPKSRLRLLSMRPHNRTSALLPDYTTVQTLNNPLKQSNLLTITNLQSTSEQPSMNQTQKSSRLSRFVKRFSMTFVPASAPVEDGDDNSNIIEPKLNSHNRFDFNNWRRRKSLSRSKYNITERDRSPLCAIDSNDHKVSMVVPAEADEPKLTELNKQKENIDATTIPNEPEPNPLPPKMIFKRRTSLSRWFPHSVKKSRPSMKLTSTPSTSNSPQTQTSLKIFRAHLLQDDMNQTMVETVSFSTKKRRKSCFYANHTSIVPGQDNMSDLSKLKSPISVSHNSSETVISNQPNGMSLTDLPIKHAASSLVNGSIMSSSFSDSQSSFEYKHSISQTDFKPWYNNPAHGMDGSICQRCCSSSGASIFSDWDAENMDPMLMKSPQASPYKTIQSTATEDLHKDETLQRNLGTSDLTNLTYKSYCDHDYLSQHSCRSLSKTSKKLEDLYTSEYGTVNTKHIWTGRLRNSVNRVSRKRILMAGTTLFNRNPPEGINYLVKHGVIAYHPTSIARFLYSDQHLNRQAIGEYFGQINDVMAAKVLREFLGFIDMKDLEVDEALRTVLSYFHPSGESQKIAFLMQLFQEVYVTQNSERVITQFQSPATIEVLAYSVLLLHTDLHNPNVRRLGKRMTQQDFIANNRGIDSDHDIQTPILEGIYRRISETQFKTLPDPSDRMRILDTILTGQLKTDNFLQRHRRFVGWSFVQQLQKIAAKRPSNRSHTHWRYLYVFNDILVIAKPTNLARIRTDHVLSRAAQAAITDIGSLRSTSSRPSVDRQTIPDASSLNSDSSDRLSETSRKVTYSSEPSLDLGPCQVKTVLPLLDLRVLVFETQCYRYGVQLCSSNGPVASFNMLSHQARQQLVSWLHESIAEMQELQIHQKQLDTERMEKLTQGTLKSKPNSSGQIITDPDL